MLAKGRWSELVNIKWLSIRGTTRSGGTTAQGRVRTSSEQGSSFLTSISLMPCRSGGQSVIRSSTISNPDSSVKFLFRTQVFKYPGGQTKSICRPDGAYGLPVCNPWSKCWTWSSSKASSSQYSQSLFFTVSWGQPFTPTKSSKHTMFTHDHKLCSSPAFKFYTSFRTLLKFHLLHKDFLQWPHPPPFQTSTIISHNFCNNSRWWCHWKVVLFFKPDIKTSTE